MCSARWKSEIRSILNFVVIFPSPFEPGPRAEAKQNTLTHSRSDGKQMQSIMLSSVWFVRQEKKA